MNNGRKTVDVLGREHSGRRFVLIGAAVIFAVWAGLFLAFRQWRERHRADVEFGRREVAAVVEPLKRLEPPGVTPKVWRGAVDDSRGMLEAVVGSGMLDRPAMERLRDELRDRFAKTSPDSAVGDLGTLWDDMEARAGPVLTRKAERPPFVPERPILLKRPTAKPPRAPREEEK